MLACDRGPAGFPDYPAGLRDSGPAATPGLASSARPYCLAPGRDSCRCLRSVFCCGLPLHLLVIRTAMCEMVPYSGVLLKIEQQPANRELLRLSLTFMMEQ